jgi:FKBP-type peptidyl-prolyl cis-trans isomerase FklB
MGSLRRFFWVVISLSALALAGCDNAGSADKTSAAAAPTAETLNLQDDVVIASYSLGFTMVDNLMGNFADSVDEDAFVRGARDRFNDLERQVSMEEARRSLNALAEKQMQALAGRAAANLVEGNTFLTENAAREGVVTLESGLQYEVLEAAEGAHPGPSDMVTTHYRGTLVDGTVFDSSYDRGEPASFPLDGVIPGWTEALQLMAVGAKWRLYIPPSLAYGEQDRGPIPGNSTLIFDVELLNIGDESGEP